MTRKRLISIFLIVVMLLSMLPTVALADDQVTYLDEEGQEQVLARSALTVISSQAPPTTLTNGWYLVEGNVTVNRSVPVTGQVHLILADGSEFSVTGESQKAGLAVETGNSLAVYAQSKGPAMGSLTAKGGLSAAGIGGGMVKKAGGVTINGGRIKAEGDGNLTLGGGAGIGGGMAGEGGQVTVNGGEVTATGGLYGAGIGGGDAGNGGTIVINGGSVIARGGGEDNNGGGAGIGGGWNRSGEYVTINGGTVLAEGGAHAAGIGGGKEGGGGTVAIHGGSVTAKGQSGPYYEGGAGIGGGFEGPGAAVLITGGEVLASGGENAPAIGAGADGNPGGSTRIEPAQSVIIELMAGEGPDQILEQKSVSFPDFYSYEATYPYFYSKSHQVNQQKLVRPQGLSWNQGQAVWQPVEAALGYRVLLFRDGEGAGGPFGTEEVSYDFLPLIKVTGDGSYTFKVQAVGDGAAWTDSDWTDLSGAFLYTEPKTVAAPLFEPAGGTYPGPLELTLSSATSGASIYYTLDGSEPSRASKLYSEKITIDRSMTVKAQAYLEGWLDSDVTQAVYTIETEEPSLPFSDVPPSAWYYTYVEILRQLGIVSGVGNTNEFRPDRIVKREEAAKMIVEAVGLEHEGLTATFDDVPTDYWATGYIAALVEKGVVSGFKGTNEFRPKDHVLRSHASKMVALAFELKMGSIPVDFPDLPADVTLSEPIVILASNGVVKGNPKTGNFNPDNEMTRAEFAKVIVISMTVTGVEKAESLKTQEAVDAAQELIDRLPLDQDLETRAYLQGRLDAVVVTG